jgi:hypothetical protein
MTDASKLEGAELDAAVARANGWKDAGQYFDQPVAVIGGDLRYFSHLKEEWSPSTDWRQGGPIIERERISVCADHKSRWLAAMPEHRDGNWGSWTASFEGPTALIAAMRAFCASRAGEIGDKDTLRSSHEDC